jgi:hypothetical protein
MFAEKPVAGCNRRFAPAPKPGFGPLAFVLLLLIVFAPTMSFAQDKAAALPTGVSLPRKGGLYAVQRNQGAPDLVRLHASQIVSNSHAGSNFARSMVYSGPHSSVELDGINASTHLSGANLSFLIRLNDDNPEVLRDQLAIIRLKQTADRRVVSGYSQNIFGGQHKRQYDLVATSKVDVGQGEENWVLVTPTQTLGPGEYGLVFIPKDPNLFASEVYDFNVDFQEAKPDQASTKVR